MYDLYLDDDKIGSALSAGELNQWLIDLNKELDEKDKVLFMADLGAPSPLSSQEFEDFLYDTEIKSPLSIRFKGTYLEISCHYEP